MKQGKKKGLIFKVDIEKAYDTLNWGFLDYVLSQMNFPLKWRSWVIAIVSTARASVLVNGSPTQEFRYERGLRQGDHLSPFLFISAMEAVTDIMKKTCSIGVFHGIPIPLHGPVLSYFLYANDVIFVGEWSIQNAIKNKPNS
ncbi:putative RNA-directed DNA polymerase [Helianthus debilis subsp. tardiflorus]